MKTVFLRVPQRSKLPHGIVFFYSTIMVLGVHGLGVGDLGKPVVMIIIMD